MTVELKSEITLKEIYAVTESKSAVPAQGNGNIGKSLVKRIVTDSREAELGDLFVGIKGERYNGNDYISEARARGAYTLSDEDKSADIFVASAYSALGNIAALYKTRLKSLKATVAITGSVGKTTTKDFITSLLSNYARVHATRGNENNLLGVPFTIFSAPQDTELLIIEAGMNHPGELSRISRIIRPDIALITNIGTAHIGNFGSREAIARAKLELFDYARAGASLFIPYGEPLLSEAPSAIRIAEGFEKKADFSIVRAKDQARLSGDLYAKGERLFSFCTGVSARQLLPNLGFAFAVCSMLGMTPKEISASATGLSDNDTRLRTFKIGALTVIDDAYNSSREAVSGALLHLKEMSARPRCALLGDMLELGYMAEVIHDEVGRLAADSVDRLYACGEYKEAIVRGARNNGLPEEHIKVLDCTAPDEIARTILEDLDRGALLIKGSHATGLYRVGELLLKSGGKNEF